MESFYDNNYRNYEVFSSDKITSQKVWNLFYDENYDLVYIFIGKVKQLKGKRLAKFHDEYKNMQSQKLVQYLNSDDVEINQIERKNSKLKITGEQKEE